MRVTFVLNGEHRHTSKLDEHACAVFDYDVDSVTREAAIMGCPSAVYAEARVHFANHPSVAYGTHQVSAKSLDGGLLTIVIRRYRSGD